MPDSPARPMPMGTDDERAFRQERLAMFFAAARLRALEVPRWSDDDADAWWRAHGDRSSALKKGAIETSP